MTDGTKILVIKLGALGDFIQALGPMAAIRRHHPEAHITLLTTKPFKTFAEDCGYFNEVIIDEKPKLLNPRGWFKLKSFFKSGHFNRVYDLQNNDRTAFYFKLISPGTEWVGAVKGATHSNQSFDRTAGHAFDGHAQTLALAGIQDVKIDTLEWMQANISVFGLRKPFVLLIPGSAPTRPEKRWPAENFGRIAQILVQWGYQPVILGGPAEQDVVEKIMRACPEALNLAGQTILQQIAALGREAAAAIGNDTGPTHLVAATGCPVLALFSSHSHPVKHAPRGEKVEILIEDDLKNLSPEKVLKSFHPRQEPPKKSAALH
jgi:ADP-heptose:LPS heptosyltransferase